MTYAQMVERLVEARHVLGREHKYAARVKLAHDLGCSEMTVRNWLRGATPLPLYAREIQRLYDTEIGDAS